MTYTAPGPRKFREMGGDLDTKITRELGLIDTEIDSAEVDVAARVKFKKVAITGGVADAFCMAWANPEAAVIIIQKIIIRITTQGATTNSVLNFGTAANGTTGSNNLITGLAATAAGIFDNITDKGASGKTSAVLLAGESITGQIKAADAAALAGSAYIFYVTA